MPATNSSLVSINCDHRCPITWDIMLDPVVADPCGHIFEWAAIARCMEQSPKCPFDQKEIVQLVPQETLRTELHAFITQHPDLFDNRSPEEMEVEVNDSYGYVETVLEDLSTDDVVQLLGDDQELFMLGFEQLMQHAENMQERPLQVADPDRPGQFLPYVERTGEVNMNGERYLIIATDESIVNARNSERP